MTCIDHGSKQRGKYMYEQVVRGDKKRVMAKHRIVYAAKMGVHPFDLPTKLLVRHTCDNKRCINPDHLVSGTATDNIRDAVVREGFSRKLTWQDVDQIRALLADGVKGKDVAKQFGISTTVVSDIKNQRIWKDAIRLNHNTGESQ